MIISHSDEFNLIQDDNGEFDNFEAIPTQKGFEDGDEFLKSGGSRLISITEAAEKAGITRQAVYVAVKQGKIAATMRMNRWFIREDDFMLYLKFKYDRKKSTYNGKLIFGNDRFSPKMAADILNVPVQQIYYAIRMGRLNIIEKTGAKGITYVISKEALLEFKNQYLNKKDNSSENVDAIEAGEEV